MKLSTDAYILITDILELEKERRNESDNLKIDEALQELDTIGTY